MLAREETLFRRTLARGVREFSKLAGTALTGGAIFTLFDTYGFPPELSLEEAVSSGLAVDPEWRPEYGRLMAEQRERSKTSAGDCSRADLPITPRRRRSCTRRRTFCTRRCDSCSAPMSSNEGAT